MQQNFIKTYLETRKNRLMLKTPFLLEIHGRYGDGAIGVKYNCSFNRRFISSYPKERKTFKTIQKISNQSDFPFPHTNRNQYANTYLYSILPVVGSKMTQRSFHFLSCEHKSDSYMNWLFFFFFLKASINNIWLFKRL